MTTYAALLRGINVGKAKRLAMADLRRLTEESGFANPRTLLNSGNVVFDGPRAKAERVAAVLEEAIEKTAGFRSKVIVVTRDDVDAVVDENTLAGVCDNPSRLLVAFARDGETLGALAPVAAQSWGSEQLAVGTRAAYLWCPAGVLDGTLVEAVGRALADRTTMRNWATVLKIQQMMAAR
jgi:uncharacterized protein (DUF1697 family)